MNDPEYTINSFGRAVDEKELENDPFPTPDCPEEQLFDYYDSMSLDDDDYDYDDDDYEDYVHPDVEIARYRDSRFYGPDNEQKICVWPLGGNFSWDEPSSGTSWIGVNGIDITCVVSMGSNQDPSARPNFHVDSTKILHIAAADMKDKSSAIHQRMLGHCSKTGPMTGPFAVVSLAPDTVQVPLKRNIECNELMFVVSTDAINFLTKKPKDRPSLTPEETEEIAVWALKYLFGSKFQSSEMKLWCSGKYFNFTISPSKIEKVSECVQRAPDNHHR